MLDERRRRLADVVQMLYKCFVFAGSHVNKGYCWCTLSVISRSANAYGLPRNTGRWPNVWLMLGQRRNVVLELSKSAYKMVIIHVMELLVEH